MRLFYHPVRQYGIQIRMRILYIQTLDTGWSTKNRLSEEG